MLIGVGQIGCSPNELAQNSPDGRTCVQRINSANQLFNNRLKSLVDNLNNNFSDAKFIYINAYGIFQDLITNPSSFGTYYCIPHLSSVLTKLSRKVSHGMYFLGMPNGSEKVEYRDEKFFFFYEIFEFKLINGIFMYVVFRV